MLKPKVDKVTPEFYFWACMYYVRFNFKTTAFHKLKIK